jgi:hypothetical protein
MKKFDFRSRLKWLLRSTPTRIEVVPYQKFDDYGMKVSITLRLTMGVLRRKGGALLLPLLVSDI